MSFNGKSYSKFLSVTTSETEDQFQIVIENKMDLFFQPDLVKLLREPNYIMPYDAKVRLEFFSWILIKCDPPSQISKFLDFHFYRYSGEKIDFLFFIEFTIQDIETLDNNLESSILKKNTFIIQSMQQWIEKKKNELKGSEIPVKPGEKIKWNGTPSQFGYLFLELVKHGFIEPPLYNGDLNYTGFARLCFQYFEIDTTPGNLTKEMNPEKNQLSDTKRAKFTIPDLSDLA